MAKQRIILVHGRNFKPGEEDLTKNWIEAIALGLKRDYGANQARKFKRTHISMAYYGDVSNKYLRNTGKKYDKKADISDRAKALEILANYKKSDFNKKTYNALDGKTSLKEGLADALSKPLEFFGVADDIIGRVAPDMDDYWNPDEQFGSDARWPLTTILKKALIANEKVLLISHSLGTIVSFDVLWKFCYYREYMEELKGKTVHTWVTLGCPLGNSTVKNKVKGAAAKHDRRYPNNVKKWINVAAEDDYISHDQTVADDYRGMMKRNLIDSIVDHRIYNLAVRKGKSNPHHGAGYLIHPTVSRIVNNWL